MARKNKYRYLWVIQGNYGYGWEDLAEYDKSKYSDCDVICDAKEYQISDNAPKRLISRRELNKD